MVIRSLSQVHRIPRIVFPRTAPVTGSLSHRKPASAGNSDSIFPLQFNIPFFHSRVSKYLTTASKRTSHFDANLHALKLSSWNTDSFSSTVTLSTFANNVDCSNTLYLVVSPTNNDDDNNKHNRTDSNTQIPDTAIYQTLAESFFWAILPLVYWLGRCVVLRKVTGLLSLFH
jgi:hypothetical protein